MCRNDIMPKYKLAVTNYKDKTSYCKKVSLKSLCLSKHDIHAIQRRHFKMVVSDKGQLFLENIVQTYSVCRKTLILVLWFLTRRITIQMTATEQYSLLVLFITLCKIFPTFEFHEIMIRFATHSNIAVLSCGAVYLRCTWGFYVRCLRF